MNFGRAIRVARLDAGLSQAELAERGLTSQATLSAYERGHKVPSATTLDRLLAATGTRLTTTTATRPVRTPSKASQARAARTFAQVLELAEALPTRHDADLRYPRLPSAGGEK